MSNQTITRKTFTDIENFIADNKASVEKVNFGLDLMARSMVLVIQGIAQEKSEGPVAPRWRSNPALANRIPVQRITGNYFMGWRIQHVSKGAWMIYNDMVEAYFIETGLHMRVRRPILKMSLIGMLRFLEGSRTEQRFLAWVLAPRRDAQGRYAAIPLASRLQGTHTLGGMAGPSGVLP
jgi:hypothetical protein